MRPNKENMNRFQIRTLSFVLSGVSLIAGQIKTLSDLTRESSRIVMGRVATADSYVGADGEIYTDVSLTPESVLSDRDGAGDAELRFTVKGGTVGDRVVYFTDVPRFEAGEDVVVFSDGAGQPMEKILVDPVHGEDVLTRIEQAREDAGEILSDREKTRARQFLRRLESRGRDREGSIILNAVSCSAYMGPKWASPATTFVIGANLPTAWTPVLNAAVQTWNTAGSKFAFTQNASSPHVIALGDLGAGNTLASTRIEYLQSANKIVKFTLTFNNRFTWSTTGETGKFDVQAIATHELGHALGLNHPSDASCSEETMWASAGSGETKKRSVEVGDKAGVVTLYGTAATSTPTPAPTPTPTPAAAAPTVTSFALITTKPIATQPLAMLFQGTNINPATVQALLTGGSCGTAGCIARPYAASTVNVLFVNLLPAGTYTLAIRNTSTGTLSPRQTFVVNPN